MKKLLISFLVFISSLAVFSQGKVQSLVKERFPRIYSEILRRSFSIYPENKSLREIEIEKQCFAFGEYMMILFSNDSLIPKKALDIIQSEAIVMNAKNPNIESAPCDQIDDILIKMDCQLAYMRIDWSLAIIYINQELQKYKIKKPIQKDVPTEKPKKKSVIA